MVSKIYISAPMSVDWSTVHSVIKQIKSDTGITPKFWDRINSYNDNDLNDADHVVFILPNNKWKAERGKLSKGIARELELAVIQNKKIYIVYKPASGISHKIYEAESDGYYIKGIASTVGKLVDRVAQENQRPVIYDPHTFEPINTNPCREIMLPKTKQVHITTILNPDYQDPRLLLMI